MQVPQAYDPDLILGSSKRSTSDLKYLGHKFPQACGLLKKPKRLEARFHLTSRRKARWNVQIGLTFEGLDRQG